jgi:hypothetical protein
VPGVQVLNEDERHPRVGAQVLKQLGEGVEPAGRCTDADDRKAAVPGARVYRAQRLFLPARAGCGSGGGEVDDLVFEACRSCRTPRIHRIYAVRWRWPDWACLERATQKIQSRRTPQTMPLTRRFASSLP